MSEHFSSLEKTSTIFPQKRVKGFTLTETLVVLGIVAVLVGLIFPVTNRIRSSAGDAACVQNLRQIGIAGHNYIMEHDGYFPGYRWYYTKEDGSDDAIRSIIPFLPLPDQKKISGGSRKGVLICPNLNRLFPSKVADGRTYGMNNNAIGYAYKTNKGDVKEPTGPTKLVQVLYPSRMVFFGDYVNPDGPDGDNNYSYDATMGAALDYSEERYKLPHNHGVQFVFLDGSIRNVPGRELVEAGNRSDFWMGGYEPQKK